MEEAAGVAEVAEEVDVQGQGLVLEAEGVARARETAAPGHVAEPRPTAAGKDVPADTRATTLQPPTLSSSCFRLPNFNGVNLQRTSCNCLSASQSYKVF